MKYSMAIVAGLVLASLALAPRAAHAQSKEVKAIQDLQRYVYDLQRSIEASKEGDDQKLANLDSLLRQTMDAVHALSGELQQLQKNMTAGMTEQQARVAEPIAVLRTSVDQVSSDTTALRNSVDTFGARLGKMEGQLTELAQLVRTLQAPPPPPPTATPTGSVESAELLYTAAQRDFASGKDDLALKGFGDFATQFPDHPNAPVALYYMGLSYDRLGDYDNAIKAYDSVVERYGENPMTRDARFSKANSLVKAGRIEDARREYQAFIDAYPNFPQAGTARDRLKELEGK